MVELAVDRIAMLPGADATPPGRDRISPAQLLAIFRRNWPLILGLGLAFAAAAYVFSKTCLTPQFTASGTIAVETQSFVIPELQGVLGSEAPSGDPMPLVRSEAQVLESRALMHSVVEDLNLTADPEFNGALRAPPFKVRIGGALRDKLPDSLAVPLVEAGVLPPAQSAPPSPAVILDNVVAAVQHNLSITNDNRSLIINIDFTSEHPELSADVVNRLIAHYTAARIASRETKNREANVALEKRVTQVHDEVEQLEQRIQETRQKFNLVQTRSGSIGQQQMEDLSSALTKASADRAQLEANYQRAAVLARVGGAGIDNSDALSSSIVGTLRDREATAERRVAQLAVTFGPGHPSRIAAEAELASARGAVITEAKRVMAGLGAQAEAARQREANLRQQLADAQTKAGKVSNVQSELAQLEKDADARRTLYQTLLQRAEQTQTKEGPEQAGARVVSPAVAPSAPSRPRPKLAAILGLFSGFAVGGLLSAAVRRRDRSYADAADLTADTGLALVAALPFIKGRNVSLATRVVSDPGSVEAEALRLLRTRLRLAGRGSVPRSVLFVGSTHGEGSSSMAAAFARVASLDGLRVLLVEGDLETPALAKLLGVAPSRGLIETLNGREHWPENVFRDTATTMDLLLVGTPQPAASRLLETMQLQSLMAEVREEYNLVVMDSSPVTQATHSLTLANIVDMVVLVVEAGETPREQVRAAVAALSGATRRPPVAALNKTLDQAA